MKSAVDNAAEIGMLLADTSIKNYLSVHPEEVKIYSSLSKQHKLLIQIKDKNRWIDTSVQNVFHDL